MTLQENQVHFFETLYSGLAFSLTPAPPEETINVMNPSQSTHLVWTNLSSGETLEGSFSLENNYLLYHQVIMRRISLTLTDI